MSTTGTWDPKYEAEVDRLVELRLKEAAPPPDAVRYNGFNVAFSDLLSFMQIYLQGFDEIAKGGPLAATVHPLTATWVAGVPRQRSATRLAGIVAASTCSILEGFLTDAADARLTPPRISRMPKTLIARLSPSRPPPNKPNKVKDALIRAVRPSARADGSDWVDAIAAVFAIKLNPAVEGSLLAMIRFRNVYIHDPQKALAATVTGEELSSWVKASLLLGHAVAASPH